TQHSPDLGDHFIVVGTHLAAVALRSPDLKKQSTSLRKHLSGASNCSRRWRDLATSAHRARTKGDKVVRVSRGRGEKGDRTRDRACPLHRYRRLLEIAHERAADVSRRAQPDRSHHGAI